MTPTDAPPPAPAPPPADPAAPGELYQRHDLCSPFPYTRGEYVRRYLWKLVQATLFRWSPPRAYGWRAWWLRRFGATLGRRAKVRPGCRVVHPWLLTLGDYATLDDGVYVFNLGAVTVGEHTTVSWGAVLCAGTHDYRRPELPLRRTPIVVGRGVWVCAEAFVGPGVTVGDNAVVGARAVVTSDVPSATVVVGNPARVAKPRERLASHDGGGVGARPGDAAGQS